MCFQTLTYVFRACCVFIEYAWSNPWRTHTHLHWCTQYFFKGGVCMQAVMPCQPWKSSLSGGGGGGESPTHLIFFFFFLNFFLLQFSRHGVGVSSYITKKYIYQVFFFRSKGGCPRVHACTHRYCIKEFILTLGKLLSNMCIIICIWDFNLKKK